MRDFGEFRRFGRSMARLAQTSYPPFLLGREVRPGEIPVFIYHDVGAAELEEDLRFLERNGYRTLSIDEYFERVGDKAHGRSVLLTFDDARRSFWENAFPVLRRCDARAVLFAPSFWVGARYAEERASTPPGFMTWQQLAECERSGLVNVESHGHRHTLVFTSSRLAGFATPLTLAHYDLFDWPMRRERGADLSGRPPLGTPIYESAPLLSAARRYIEPAAAAAACRSLVEAAGAERFFARRSAIAELRAAHDAVTRRVSPEPMPEHVFRASVEAELALAVDVFRRELGRSPRYFAYPWRLGSRESLAMLADLGFEAAFGVALDFRRARSTQGPLAVHARYKSDWLRFLPGNGRRRLGELVPNKVAAFLKTQHLAH